MTVVPICGSGDRFTSAFPCGGEVGDNSDDDLALDPRSPFPDNDDGLEPRGLSFAEVESNRDLGVMDWGPADPDGSLVGVAG